MAIVYDKLLALLKERGITTYQIQRTSLIGHETYSKLLNHTGGLTHKVLNRLCAILEVQPGDLMEYVPDDQMAARYGTAAAEILSQEEKDDLSTPDKQA